MLWHLIRYLVSFAFPAFYKRIEAKNIDNLKTEGPTIIAMNHPNAFLDPICITWVAYPVRTSYMARGDAFKPGLAAYLLTALGIVPIFRLRDAGREGLAKNDESYEIVFKLLKRKAKIIIFAEGLCIQERRLRPLKKGVARLVFGAYDTINHPNLKVIPVGLNYTNPSKFRSKLFYNVGEPILVKDLIKKEDNQAKTYNQFLKLLDEKMRELVTHIKNKENDDLVVQLEEMVMKDWLQKMGFKNNLLENEFQVTKKLTDVINTSDENNPEKTKELREKTNSYFNLLRKNNLRDWLINPLNIKANTKTFLLLRCLALIFMMPVYLIGLMGAYMPYKLTILATKKLVKNNKEFYSSMIVGLGSFIFLFNFILLFFITYIFTPTVIEAILITVLVMLCSWLSKEIHFFIIKTKGLGRMLKNKTLTNELVNKRQEIVNLLNELTNFKV